MCVGSEFQVDGAETENAREVKLLVMRLFALHCVFAHFTLFYSNTVRVSFVKYRLLTYTQTTSELC